MIQFSKEKLCLVLVLQDISASLEGDAILIMMSSMHTQQKLQQVKKKAIHAEVLKRFLVLTISLILPVRRPA